MTPAAVESLAFVEWQGPSTYVTARGLLPSAEPERVPVPVGECPF